MNKWVVLILCVVICESVGIAGTFFTTPTLDNWYLTIQKPSWNPPGWLFGPVWTCLYLMMGVSVWLIWSQYTVALQNNTIAPAGNDMTATPATHLHGKTTSFTLCFVCFAIQLVLNGIWTPLFFGLKNPGLAFADICALWLAIVATIVVFYRVNKLASWLLIPYWCWVSFASVLNFTLWQLNSK